MRTLMIVVALVVGTSAIADDKKPDPKETTVEGKIYFGEERLTGGVIVFAPQTGTPVYATIQENGTYVVKGLSPEEYKIGVLNPPAEKGKNDPPTNKGPLVPTKYGDPKTSGLSYKVAKEKQTFDIHLRAR